MKLTKNFGSQGKELLRRLRDKFIFWLQIEMRTMTNKSRTTNLARLDMGAIFRRRKSKIIKARKSSVLLK